MFLSHRNSISAASAIKEQQRSELALEDVFFYLCCLVEGAAQQTKIHEQAETDTQFKAGKVSTASKASHASKGIDYGQPSERASVARSLASALLGSHTQIQ